MPTDTKSDSSVHRLGVETARRGVVYLVGEVISSLISLVVLIFLARILESSSFGIFAIVIAFNTLLGIGGNFGIGAAFRKKLPQIEGKGRQTNTTLSSGYSVALILGLVISLIGIAISGYLASNIYHIPSMALALQIASAVVFFTVLYNVSNAALVGLGRVSEASIANVLYAVVQMVAVFGLVLLGYGVIGAIIGVAISFIIPSLYELTAMYIKAKVRFVRPQTGEMKGLTLFSIPVIVSFIAVLGAENLAILLLGAFAPTLIVGNYNVAYKIGGVIEIILTSNTFILLPAFAKVFAKKELSKKIDRVYNNSLFYTLLFLLPVVFYLVSVATPLVHLLFGSTYTYAPLYFAIVAVGYTLGIIGSYAGILIISYGDTRKFMKYQVTAVVIEIGLLLLLTPTFKALGALAALYIFSPIILDLIYIKALYNQFKFRHRFRQLLNIVVPSIIMLLLCYYVTGLLQQSRASIIINLVLVILIYPALVGTLKGISKKNIDFIRAISKTYRIGFVANYILSYAELFVRD